ncbi:uncharacterized protein BJ212DRAFT_1317598 [Suillus subaureus]|uniref:Uncharacterized protein n=1 Tax=Suillus subaureus TaxID=48587 RepID=A0A9P7ENN6_9AGAM|nr:uncharacterized protein BJ212DRAFT_1317598 [Suillus subaureus]KAG1826024.1 hypothetical protein BJ212DRAFT_1317598 [Suillus subaureus]
MPAITQPYEVLLDFTNDTHDCATIQLLRDYGRNTSAVVLLHPGESLTLVLEAGSMYKYALKSHSKVANVRCVCTASPSLVSNMFVYSARSWRDIQCEISHLFAASPPSWASSLRGSTSSPASGVTVDRVWRDSVLISEANPFDERLYPEGQKPSYDTNQHLHVIL